MALGGGTFVLQNKKLPGAYINFVSAASANPSLSDRGIATMALELDWGADDEIFEVTSGDFQKDSRKIFGYDYTHEKLKGLRDLFLNAKTLYAYKLTSGGKKAECTVGTLRAAAKHCGVRGNDLSVAVLEDVDGGYDVQVYLGGSLVSEYKGLANAEELHAIDDPYVDFSSTIREEPGENVVPVKEPAKETSLYGKHAGDFQTGVSTVCDGDTVYISGTLHYVEGFTEFDAKNPELQKGNYFAIATPKETFGETYTVYRNGEVSRKDVNNDGFLVMHCAPGKTFGIQPKGKDTITTLNFDRVSFEQPQNGDGSPAAPVRRGEQFTLTAGAALSGGENGEAGGDAHQKYLDLIESYTFNTMGVVTSEETVKSLYLAFCRRLRDEMGVKFQVVIHDKASDYYGAINVKNRVTDDGWDEGSLVYWVTGAEAGCAVNRSLQNTIYNGEFAVDTNLTQSQLTQAIDDGEFVLHKVGSDVRVLTDINSMVTTSDGQGDVFKDNQTVRVIDQIGNDIAVLFNTKYLGVVPNDNAGRISLWSDIVKHHEQLQTIRAIEDFSGEDVTVEPGETKKAVVVTDRVTPVNAMDKLYMTVMIS